MKSKIEKIKGKYYIYPKNSKDEVVEYLNALCEKQNEIIDHLNSQDQEEVKNPEYDGIREVERQKFKNIVDTVNKRYPQDAPEEWVEKLWELIDVYRDSKDINSELEGIEEVNQYVEQLLDERECRAREELGMEIYDFVESESGKSGRKEILEFISKLKQ